MKRSEIFDSFVKIAQEKGMISNDSSEAKKKIEQTGRAGSDDISTIEALYGVKPDSSVEYKTNIMEAAHPNSVVLSPAYDKLNGLVENNIERQNILLHIVNKPVNGLSTQHKYAQKELILSLVRIGNDLDNKGKEELRALADACLEQATAGSMKKEAVAPLAIAGVAAVAALLGGLYLKQHMRFISDGISQDHAKLIGEIDDLLNSNTDWGVGYQYKGEFTQMMASFKAKLETFFNLFKKIEPIINELEKPRDGKELLEWAKLPESGIVQKAIAAFRASADNLLPEMLKIQSNFNNEAYKQRQTEDKGWMSSLIDKTQILHGGKGLVADDFDDVKHALETYLLDIKGVLKTLSEAQGIQAQAKRDLEMASSKSSELFGSPSSGTDKPSEMLAENKPKSQKEIDDGADELTKSLEGLKGLTG